MVYIFASELFFPSKIYSNSNIKEAEQEAASIQMKYDKTEEEKENLCNFLMETE